MKIRFDPLIVYIFLAIFLAFLLPHDWIDDYGNLYDSILKWGVSLIFFLYGIKIPYTEFLATLKKWRLHLTIQSTTYFLFPIIIIGSIYLCFYDVSDPIILGFLFLAVLPSTVSSSVVMTSWADGNIAVAVFNSFITGMLGVVITPLWMTSLLGVTADDVNIWSIYQSLLVEVVLPLVLGILLQKYLRQGIMRHPNIIANYDKMIIFLIIFKAFSVVFKEQLLSLLTWEKIIYMFIGIVLIFGVMSIWLLFISQQMKLLYKDKMAVYFCGVQKSFVHASVFSKIIFKNSPHLGFILMPTMIYHLFQIILTSILAQYFKSQSQKTLST